MRLIDTHAHLDMPKLSEQLDAVLTRAKEAGVARIVTIGASRGLESNYQALKLASAHPELLRCTAGIHPHDADMASEEVIAEIARELAEHPLVVGIGETGLDYHYDKSERDNQRRAFRAFLQMSQAVNKPVIIHSREAEEDTLKLIDEAGVRGGILHCFTGSRAMAEALWERDFYLSFSGIVTFKNGAELLAIARDTPAERILVETDSPYLAPIPFRGKLNEPSYVRHTAAMIAQAREVELEAFAAQTWDNACRVFGWA